MQGVRTAKMAQLMGVTPQTIRKYVRNNSIPFHELPSGQLLFTKEDQDTILRNKQTPEPQNQQTWAFYVRSSSGNKQGLEEQVNKLKNSYPEPTYVIKDSASGLNEKRRGLTRLIKLA